MSILKWYAGGQDRAEQAISILTELVADLNHSQQKMPLQQVLSDYIEAFRKKDSAVPFILSRMNLDISSALKKQIVLTVSESDKLDALMALANIRYGY
ncbi:bacteriocin immunity protein [Lacticaseibacillus paracasei]|uniref:bacteriocin immunity protein n=1 Tax=Lacticaseibacillus paracasei TaxID=1597 RepID=UPI000E59E049|nr:bacteriocin immunity protein [Lacticaseibacillus paracasei]RHX71583.1 bacteriocin immunity protein [Lacticaseibacillus paracasei]